MGSRGLFVFLGSRTLQFLGILVGFAAVCGCNGGSSISTPPPPSAQISISSPSNSVNLGAALQFTATITGSTGSAVWSVSSGAGTISSNGLYTAPATMPAGASVVITAKLSTDSSVSASQTITLVAPPSISINAPGNFVGLGNSLQFTATISGSMGTAVWSVSSGAGSISAAGLYTAPASLPTNPSVTITAALSSNSAVSTSTSITIVALPTITGSSLPSLPMGENNAVMITGTGFMNGTVILMNGSAVNTVYQSSTSLMAVLSAEPGVASPLALVAANPGAMGASAVFQLPLTAPASTTASIGTTPVLTIPQGFLGLSHEWGDGEWTMGDDARARNTGYRHLLRNLMDSQSSSFLIRMGGGSSDSTTTPASVEEFNELSQDLPGVKFSAGVILGNSLTSTPATAETIAQAYVSGMSPGILDSIEIGNETDNYQYQSTRDYTFDVYNQKYSQWASGILQTVTPATPKFTGPSWALMRSLLNDSYWSNYVNEPPGYLQLFIAAQKSNTKTITQRRICSVRRRSSIRTQETRCPIGRRA
jgi:hypothetical protein